MLLLEKTRIFLGNNEARFNYHSEEDNTTLPVKARGCHPWGLSAGQQWAFLCKECVLEDINYRLRVMLENILTGGEPLGAIAYTINDAYVLIDFLKKHINKDKETRTKMAYGSNR